jgi:hypothetical protein
LENIWISRAGDGPGRKSGYEERKIKTRKFGQNREI